MDRLGRVADLKKSPFAQAKDSMFALRDLIIGNFGRGLPRPIALLDSRSYFPTWSARRQVRSSSTRTS